MSKSTQSMAEFFGVDPSQMQEPEALRGVWIKSVKGGPWTLCQRPPERKSRYSDQMIREGKQPSGALVYHVHQVPASVTDEEVVRLANRSTIAKHFMAPVNPDPHCWLNYRQLGEGEFVK